MRVVDDIVDGKDKLYRRGTHRGCHPGETFERFRGLMKHCGITRLANITGLDSVGIPVYVAVRPNSRGLSTAQGKGLDKEAARTSAMMEAFEAWHGERVLSSGSYLRQSEVEEVHGVRTIDLTRVSRRGFGTGWMRTSRLNWVQGQELLRAEPMFVPYDCVSTDFTNTSTPTPLIRTTNGLASGNSYSEAVLHGIYEVVERDAVSMWSPRAGVADKIIDPSSVTDDYNAALLRRLDKAGLGVLIRWLSCDTRVPVISVALAPGDSWRTPPYASFAGYGAHLDPKVALARALTEAVQSRLTLIHGSRDDLWPSLYAKVLDHRAAAAWVRHVGSMQPNMQFSEIEDLSTDSFKVDLARVLDLLRPVVHEVVAVELTHAELGIPVAAVVIPGLAGIPFDDRPRAGGRASMTEGITT